jgi:GDP-4-dehydro-6-deoxy-D-mannose reductase
MARVLVTGASGFIAGHLLPKLQASGHQVTAICRERGDLSRQDAWIGFPPADTVVHLAGRSFVPESWKEPAAYIDCNVMGTAAALEYCRQHGANLIFLSSYMYGNPDSLPIKETAPIRVNNPYALSKKLAEDVARFFSDRFGLHVSVLRLFNVYGPGQGEKFIVPSVIRQVRSGSSVQVKDLEPRRDYVYVTDVTDAIARAMSIERGFGVYNIGSGVSHSVEQLIRQVQSAWQTSLPVVSDGERRPDEIMDTVADISEARHWLGWEPKVSLSDGLRDMRLCERNPHAGA